MSIYSIKDQLFKLLLSSSLFLLVIIAIGFIFTTKASALSWFYPSFNVDIEIKEDTSFTVSETATFVFTGTLNGLRRDITLHDSERSQMCIDFADYTCGGFEFLTIERVEVDGVELSDDEYKIYEVFDEYSSDRWLRVEKRLYDEGTYVDSEEHTWTIDYTVYGGIQWMPNSAGFEVPFFYWNVLPENRGGNTESSEIAIKFPKSVQVNNEKATVYSREQLEAFVTEDMKELILRGENFVSYTPITVSYEFGQLELIKPAKVTFDYAEPYFGKKVYFNDGLLPEDFSGTFEYVPAGTHKFGVERFGYEPIEEELTLAPLDEAVVDVKLKPVIWMQVFLALNDAIFILGIIFVPFALVYVHKRYKRQGVDEDKAKTIIPLFKPPEGMRPYIVGSLVDEVVDKSDITGSIIDLAYRGFIHIKELKKKKYELIKKNGKIGETLDWFEKELIDILFGDKDSVKIHLLSYSKVKKLFNLKTKIYKDMVDKGYFKENPDLVRKKNYGFGISAIIIGLILSIAGSIGVTYLLGVFTFITSGVALFGMGVMLVAYAKYMPAKTKLGSEKHAEILGFKMYLHSAERYRLKDLKPEDFEAFLAYAVVLGVEREWAKSFKDIYNTKPEWYEGSSDVLDALYWSRWARNFNSQTRSQFSSTVRSAGGYSSGSGWSGGGSFGGFSGGGGGGGASGGW